ncbi:hypothetical protein [Chryseobacterium indologenes]|nr:hypothetical protein [Chryseobacterium indologenes]
MKKIALPLAVIFTSITHLQVRINTASPTQTFNAAEDLTKETSI